MFRPTEIPGRPYRDRGRLFIPLNVENTNPMQIAHGMQDTPIGVSVAMCTGFNRVKILEIGQETMLIQFETAPNSVRLEVF